MKILQTTYCVLMLVSLVACGANNETNFDSSSDEAATASLSENQASDINTPSIASFNKIFTESFLNASANPSASTSTAEALPAHLQTSLAETADVSPELLDLESALLQSSGSNTDKLSAAADSNSTSLTNINVASNSPNNSTLATARATASVVALGRVLFYDKQLSFNNTISCASCHQPQNGFADTSRFSTGFSGGSTTAHSMRLINLRNYTPGRMFWDKRARTLEAQTIVPITHRVEMGFDSSHGGINALLRKMRTISYYPALFRAAFGNTTINTTRISQALAQFERTIVSTNSAWDTGFAANFDARLPDRGINKPIASFTAEENRGRELFMARAPQGVNCAACHAPPSFALTGNSRSNGLDAAERRVFKAPSLKSVALAGAFMHDGRFSSLEQVVEHYNSGVKLGPALDNRLRTRNGQPRRLNLSEDDKAALVAFLKTLTDTTLATNPNFSDPFK